ncbi:hypothetical protein DRQ09_01895, partial [candidate division KSB1 bacterium]
MKSKKIKNKRKKRFIKRIFFIFKLIIFLSIISGTGYLARRWGVKSDIFTVKNFEFEGNIIVTNEQLNSIVKTELSKNIFKIDSKRLIESIKKIPFVETVSVSKKLPSVVKIKLEEIKPLAYLIDKKIYTIDLKGRILPKLKPTRVYDLILISGIKKSEITERRKQYILEFISLLKREDISLYNEISEVNFSGDRIVMFL